MKEYSGGCLCGDITYSVKGKPTFPHLCSCHACQKWSGAPTVAWVEFPLKNFKWDGPGDKPTYYRSSEKTRRGFCSKCGSALCALDDESQCIPIMLTSLHDRNFIIPYEQHSFEKEALFWWKVRVVNPAIDKT